MGKKVRFRTREEIHRKKVRWLNESTKRKKNSDEILEKMNRAISTGNHERVISLTKPLREQGLLIGFSKAAEAYKLLKNEERVLKIIKQAVERGYPEIYFAKTLLELYFSLGEHTKLLELWDKVKNDLTLSFHAYITMIKFFALTGNLEEAKKLYERAIKMHKANVHYVNGAYIRFVLEKGSERELYKFINELQEKNLLTSDEFGNFLEVLYKWQKYEDILKFSLALNGLPKLQSTKSKNIYFEALRKLKRYDKVLEEIDSYIESLETDKTWQNAAKVIKAQCLNGIGQLTGARRLLIELLQTLPYYDSSYARCLCEYIFCNPELDLTTATKFLRILEEKRKQSWDNKNLCEDITCAIERLENTYNL